jgi:hypothetical protein
VTVFNLARSRAAVAGALSASGTTIVFGAALLSAIGSLPLHLMPLIVATLVEDGRASLVDAGWVASSVLLGQLSAALSLPAIRIRAIHRTLAIGIIVTLLIGLLGTLPESRVGLFLGWFVAGLCCGALQYLGFTTAASSTRPALAFALRLGIVMIVAGAVVAGVRVSGAFASYEATVTVLSLLTGCVAVAGLALYRMTAASTASLAAARRGAPPVQGIIGLATLLVLFMGQTGFMAYAIQGAAERGLPLADTVVALAAMKIVVGVWLVYAARSTTMPRSPRLFAAGAVLALGVLAVAAAEQLALFFLGLLVFEIAFNSLSAALQAKVVEAAPELGRDWLTAAALVGAALGPPLNGGMIALEQGRYFIAFAMISALMPALWTALQRPSVTGPQRPPA